MKKICVITGTRAEYGLLLPVIEKIKEDNDMQLQLLVTGSHLSREFGYTCREIEEDNLRIDGKVYLNLCDDQVTGISNSMSIALVEITKQFQKLLPDLIILLGDRYETFMAAVAATIAKIPIAHIHGGELTEGAMDDAFRHSISKMSHLHFTSTEAYRRRVIQLGEQPDKVFNVGALGVENLKKITFISKKELAQEIGFPIGKRTLLVTFHPVTLEANTSDMQFRELLAALDELTNINIIFTKANADMDGRIINRLIDEYVGKHSEKVISYFSMGQQKYLSAMKYCGAVVGNSSSGIIEAPSLSIPTVNIGDRQRGRVQAKSIVNCEPRKNLIVEAINQCLEMHEHDSSVFNNPYEGENTLARIIEYIKDHLYNNKLSLKKQFFDIRID